MSIFERRPLFALLLLSVLLISPRGYAQLEGVEIDIQRENLGLGGIVQPGVWTPVRVDLTNNGAENVEVHCRWLLSDVDGDQLVAQRSNITLQPQRTQGVWLYATPPMSTRSGQSWTFQAVEVSGGQRRSAQATRGEAGEDDGQSGRAPEKACTGAYKKVGRQAMEGAGGPGAPLRGYGDV